MNQEKTDLQNEVLNKGFGSADKKNERMMFNLRLLSVLSIIISIILTMWCSYLISQINARDFHINQQRAKIAGQQGTIDSLTFENANRK